MGNRYNYQTFKQWCVKNNRQDILDLWDYDKNIDIPSEISYSTKEKYYFKCPNGLHGSELKMISVITRNTNYKLLCEQCRCLIRNDLRNSQIYKDYRDIVLANNNYRCIICGSNKKPEVHHIYPFATSPHDRINPNTGICLCREHHSISCDGSFHRVYGLHNNTPEQLEEYVNIKRKELGIDEYFDVYKYMSDYEDDDLYIDDSMLDI